VTGVGAQAVEAIVEARGDRPFADLADFAARINPRTLNRKTLENLACAGAFDALEPNRARALAAVEQVMPRRSAAPRAGRSARTNCSAARVRRRCACPMSSPGCRPAGSTRNTRPSASSSPAIRSTTTRRR
jgi:DNA polymerase III alpha subunit